MLSVRIVKSKRNPNVGCCRLISCSSFIVGIVMTFTGFLAYSDKDSGAYYVNNMYMTNQTQEGDNNCSYKFCYIAIDNTSSCPVNTNSVQPYIAPIYHHGKYTYTSCTVDSKITYREVLVIGIIGVSFIIFSLFVNCLNNKVECRY